MRNHHAFSGQSKRDIRALRAAGFEEQAKRLERDIEMDALRSKGYKELNLGWRQKDIDGLAVLSLVLGTSFSLLSIIPTVFVSMWYLSLIIGFGCISLFGIYMLASETTHRIATGCNDLPPNIIKRVIQENKNGCFDTCVVVTVKNNVTGCRRRYLCGRACKKEWLIEEFK